MTPTIGRLLPDTVRALRSRDLRFTGTPKVVRRPASRSLFVTDSKSIFVKLTVKDPIIEATGARHAATNGIATPRLLTRPLQVDDTYQALVFKWLPEPRTATEPDPAAVAALMGKIWSLNAPTEVRNLPWDTYEARARASINRTPQTPLALQNTLDHLIDTAMASVRAHLADRGDLPAAVWTHGDLHGRNLVTVNERLYLMDWEHHGMTLREQEAAKYLQTALAEPPDGTVPDVSVFLDHIADLGLDMTLLWRLTALKAASAAAYYARPQHIATHGHWLAHTIDLSHRAAATQIAI